MRDALTTLLSNVRLETSLFGRIELGAPWGVRLDGSDSLSIHHVVEGEMWLGIDEQTLRVGTGDILLLPHGTPHSLRHAKHASLDDPPPWMSAPPVGSASSPSVYRRLGGRGRRTVVLCATMRATGAARALLVRALPSAVHIVGAGREPIPNLTRLLDCIRDEVQQRRPGSPILAARLAELLLLQTIRVELERRARAHAWPTVLGDMHVERALRALYEAPQRAWTVASLARLAGLSRSAFAHTFREQVGESPLRHLTRWRIELAKDKLVVAPEMPIIDIALDVGYRTEAAFSVAFRRETGAPPGAYRREHLARTATAR